jgi:tetratricopeptide (TPR) repeat protein
MKRTLWAAGFAATAAFGCATSQVGKTSATGPEDEVPGASGGTATKASDPLAAGASKPGLANAPKRNISDDQHADFAKAMARFEKSRRDGTFKNECGSIASDFKSIADSNAAIVEARGNQAAVLGECGREQEAQQIWESLAQGGKPYAPAIAQLGYVAWKSGDLNRAETLFQRAIDTDKQLGSVSARLNLAQIVRDKARRASGVEEKNRYIREAIEHLRTVLAVDGNNLQAYATLCYFYYDLELLEMARLVADQAIWRAEEIATGKVVGRRESLAETENKPAKGGKGKKADKADDEAPSPGMSVAGTGYTPEMKKALGMVYNTLGLVWLKRKDVTQGIANFRRAVELDPEL